MQNILIVDDTQDDRYLLTIILEKNGYNVTAATNGSEALEIALKNPPDMIVSDILMPVMDGFKLCTEWKKSKLLSGIPFVFYTATYTDPRDEDFALKLGADRFLVKPTDPELLISYLNDVIKNSANKTKESEFGSEEKYTDYLRSYNKVLIRKLEEKVDYFRAIFNTDSSMIVVLTPEGKVVEANHSARQLLCLDGGNVYNRNFLECIIENKVRDGFRMMIETVCKGSSVRDYETKISMGDGSSRTVLWNFDRIAQSSDTVIEVLITGRDITILKKAEEERSVAIENTRKGLEEKEILLRELYHRTKNNMQVISSLLSLEERYYNDEKVRHIVMETNNRIRSMSLVHTMLYNSKNLSMIYLDDYIASLVKMLLASYAVSDQKIHFNYAMSRIAIMIDAAVPCGLALTEILSNIFKHAFPGKKTGEVTISLSDNGSEMVILEITDNGPGLPEGLDVRTHKSLGFQLIFLVVEGQLKGKVVFSNRKGLCCSIRFPYTKKSASYLIQDISYQ